MRVFVTGATGFIGAVLVPELIAAGHQVLGLTRSDEGAAALAAAGAEVHRGSLEDIEGLRRGASGADGVVHLAFNHDFSKFAENCEADRRVIEAIGGVLAGSDRPFLVTSGTAVALTPGRPTTETDPANSPMPRAASEAAVDALVAQGVRVGVVRLPQVHDPMKQGLITYLVAVAREKGVSAYVGDGANRWPAVHVSDAARAYRLALETLERGARYNPVAEEGVPLRLIAEAIGRRLNVPVMSIAPDRADAHFGWLGPFASHDIAASSKLTRERLGWAPTGPDLMTDLNAMKF